MADAGITTAVVSWWGRPDVEGTHDTQGVNSDGFLLELMDDAAAEGIMVSLHMEPYRNRSIHSIKADLEYINTRYADHPAMLWCKLYRSSAGVQQWQHEPSTASRCASASGTRTEHCGPVVYVFDSYHITAKEWGLLLGDSEAPETHADREDSEGAVSSIRGTDLDVVAIGLWLERTSGKDLRAGGFDGGYTYFGAAGFSYGSTPGRWPSMAKEASQLGLLFMPSVAPGYDDSRIRPWNKANVRRRNGGQYYREMWEAALSLPVPPASVGVSTFNEWGEGTQIEPAVPRTVPEGKGIPEEMRRGLGASNTFKDYGDLGPRGYLDITREMAGRLAGLQSKGADGGSVAGGARAEEL